MNSVADKPAWSVLWLSLPTVVPLLVVLGSWFNPQPDVWAHLNEFVLPTVIKNTVLMALGVALMVGVLGVGLAWLTAVCEFPGRRWFAWALVLPLALPGYVLASVMVGLFDYSGPVQTALRAWLGPVNLPPIRSMTGAVIVFGLVLYPYVYLLARQAFITQGKRSLEAAQTLGMPRWLAFFRVALPMSRPWWAAGITLALMEMLADFGTVAIFNVDTFTTAIYKAWLALFNLPVASQLASLLAFAVLLLVWLEQRAIAQRRYAASAIDARMERLQLNGYAGWAACAVCALVLLLAFLIPLFQLTVWSLAVIRHDWDARYWGFIAHSLMLSSLSALIVVAMGLWLAYAQRQHPGPITRLWVRISTLGYALPGMLLSVGLFMPIAWLDRQLYPLWQSWGVDPAPVLKGTLLVMLLALAARFLAVGFEPMQAAMQRITISQQHAAQSLGLGRWQVLQKLFLPLLRSGWLGASLLVFVEVMKEMPITLMTRPFDWDTLAVRVYEMSAEGMWDRAALPSLCIVLVGLLPVLLLIRQTER
ncbi:MAG: ABC transporter permease [Burkholderiaceae bacterium]